MFSRTYVTNRTCHIFDGGPALALENSAARAERGGLGVWGRAGKTLAGREGCGFPRPAPKISGSRGAAPLAGGRKRGGPEAPLGGFFFVEISRNNFAWPRRDPPPGAVFPPERRPQQARPFSFHGGPGRRRRFRRRRPRADRPGSFHGPRRRSGGGKAAALNEKAGPGERAAQRSGAAHEPGRGERRGRRAPGRTPGADPGSAGRSAAEPGATKAAAPPAGH